MTHINPYYTTITPISQIYLPSSNKDKKDTPISPLDKRLLRNRTIKKSNHRLSKSYTNTVHINVNFDGILIEPLKNPKIPEAVPQIGLSIRCVANSKGTIIFSHGIHQNIGSKMLKTYTNEMVKLNPEYNIIVYDWLGYGGSTGNIRNLTTNVFYNSLESVIKYLFSYFPATQCYLKDENHPLFLVGYSLGTGIVTGTTRRINTSPTSLKKISGIALIAPYTNFKDNIRKKTSAVVSNLSNIEFNNYEDIQYANCPVIIHISANDKVISFTGSLATTSVSRFDKIGTPTFLHIFRNCSHSFDYKGKKRSFSIFLAQ